MERRQIAHSEDRIDRARERLLLNANTYIENRVKYRKGEAEPKGKREARGAHHWRARARDLLQAIARRISREAGSQRRTVSVAGRRGPASESGDRGRPRQTHSANELIERACRDIEEALPNYRTFSNNKDEMRDRFISMC